MEYNMSMNKVNFIHNGDCIEFMKNSGDLVDLILTSPPYNMTKRPGGDADSGRYDEYEDWKEADEYLEIIDQTLGRLAQTPSTILEPIYQPYSFQKSTTVQNEQQ